MQLILLDLQGRDSALAQLDHRRRTLPEIAKLAELTAKAVEADGRRIEFETEVSDLTREQKKADLEVEQVKARRARDEERLNSGAIANPKDLESLQHELTALERRIGTLEDEELEVMEALEEAQARLTDAATDLANAQADVDQVSAARDAALASIDQDALREKQERDALVGQIPGDLLALYEKIRSQYAGLGAAALRARRCEACRLELNGADLRELAAKPDDEVLRCPECSRILVRTAESGI